MTLAQNSDVIIAVLGGSSARNFDMEFLRNGAVSSKGINMDSGENVDVASLSLGGYQEQLIEQLYQLGKPIITILVQGRPYDLMKIESFTNAIATAWFPGQEGGKAIAQMISGRNNPSGRLSLSYPRNSRQLPVYYYQRAASKQENYYDLSGSPFYPFGHGLSYTTFEYSQMEVKTDIDKVIISIKVKNTGSVSGKTSTLVYVRLIDGVVIQRTKLLKAFRKDELRSQEERLLVLNSLLKTLVIWILMTSGIMQRKRSSWSNNKKKKSNVTGRSENVWHRSVTWLRWLVFQWEQFPAI